MDTALLQEYFSLLREESLPAQWSRAVQLSRHLKVIREFIDSDDDIALRVFDGTSPGGFYVVHTIADGLWQCDCSSPQDPCVHVLSTAIILKTGREIDQAGSDDGTPILLYEMMDHEHTLMVRRFIQQGDTKEPLTESLKTLLGGVQSGRLAMALPRFINEDFVLDELLTLVGGTIRIERVDDYLKLLSRVHHLMWNGKELRVDLTPYSPSLSITPAGNGFLVKQAEDVLLEGYFSNQLLIYDGTLRRWIPGIIPDSLKSYATRKGVHVSATEIDAFVADVLPVLEGGHTISSGKDLLPESVDVEPLVLLDMQQEGDNLHVIARLHYGDPPLAEVRDDLLVPENKQRIPRRKRSAERLLEQELRRTLHLTFGRLRTFRGDDAYAFLQRAEGWPRSSDAPVIQEAGQLEPRVRYHEGHLDISFHTQEGKHTAISFSDIKEALRNGQSVVGAGHQGWFLIPEEWYQSNGAVLERMLELQGGSSLPASCLPSLMAYYDQEQGTIPPSLKGYEMLIQGTDPSMLPETFLEAQGIRATLRPYQEKGVAWLQARKQCGTGGILADDMGLGKTLQALCVVSGMTLIVCPTSVMTAWEEQCALFRPEISVVRYHGTGRSVPECHSDCLVLTTYALLWRDSEILCAQQWDCVVLDESQHIKNPESNTAQAAHQLQAEFRLALTGTPLENSLEDLWSQFEFVAPGLLGSRRWFQDIASSDEVARIKMLIHPFILRRTKSEVAKDLPEKVESTLWCEFSEEEASQYKSVLRGAHAALQDDGASMASMLEYLLRLRQFCCHPELMNIKMKRESSKVTLLYESLEQSKANGHRMLVFSQWTSFLDIVEVGLKERGLRFTRLDGSTRDRESVITGFQEDDTIDVMLLSLKAGGTGITLTAADHVYLLDPWWNPAVEQQASDRAHRIGQTKTVFVYRLAVRNSVEEKILALQEQKKELSEFMLEQSRDRLSKDDIRALLTSYS